MDIAIGIYLDIDELWLMYQLFVSDNIGNYQNHYYWSSTLSFSSIGAFLSILDLR